MGDVSPEQDKIMDDVKKYLTDTLKITDRRWNNWYILRFCRARKFDYAKIIEMINKFLDWGKLINLQDIGNLDLEQYQKLRVLHNHGYYNTDRQGRPIYIEEAKKMKVEEIFSNYTDDLLMLYYIQSYERLIHVIFPECSKVAGRRIEQTCSILDLKDVNITKLLGGKVKAFLKIATDIGQNYYPEILGNMYIVNGGLLFSAAWMIVKPWLDPKTQQKISIISGSGKKELAAAIDPQFLPDFLGGTCTRPLSEDFGPWKEALELSKQRKTVLHHDQGLVDHFFLSDKEKAKKAADESQNKAPVA